MGRSSILGEGIIFFFFQKKPESYSLAIIFLFTMPQKLSKSTLSVPWIHDSTACTSLFTDGHPETSRSCTCTPSATCAGIPCFFVESWPARFTLRRACRDQTFSAARPVPMQRLRFQDQYQRRELSSVSRLALAVSMDVSGGSVKVYSAGKGRRCFGNPGIPRETVWIRSEKVTTEELFFQGGISYHGRPPISPGPC